MTEPNEIWSSQLRIVAGRAVEDAPQVGFAERVDQLGRMVRLSILAEPAAEGGEAFMDQFVRRIGELFDPAARSLTGALKLAVETAHEELRAWNRQHLPAEHAMYGLSCLMQREDRVAVLGQAGPSAGLIAGDAGLAGLRSTTLYSHLPRSTDPVAAAIGGSDPINLEFAAGPDAVDGWALLLTSNAASLLDAERRVRLSRLAVDETLRDLYPSMVNLRDAAGLVVSLSGPDSSDSSDSSDQPSPPDVERDAPTDEFEAEEVEPDVVDPAASVPAESDQTFELDEPDAADDQPSSRARMSAPTANIEQTRANPEPSDAPQASSQAGSPAGSQARRWNFAFEPAPPTGLADQVELAELEVVGWPVNPFAAPQIQQIETLNPARPAPMTRLTRPIMDLGQAIPSLLERRDEPAVERPRIRTRDPRVRGAAARRAGLVLIGMLVLLAGVAAVLLGPSLLQSADDQFRSRVERSRNALAASQLASTTEASRLALLDARSEVEAALAINPLAPDALQLQEEIEAVLAELNLVQSPGALTVVADLSRFGPSIALGSVRFGGGRAFVLDDAGGRVFSVNADGAVTLIFLEGELLGLGSQLRAGRPISIAWQSTAQSGASASATSNVQPLEDALWILDSHARLYRWTASGVLLVPIPDQILLGSVDAVAATSGSVYLLDQAGGAIWRFAVERSELSEPSRAVGRTDLLNAEEFAATVNASGEIEFLVASSDGRLRRYSADEELPLALDLERELLAPASLSLGAQSGLVYVVDRGQGRIIAVGPDGGVVSQIQSAELADLRGAWVNEQTGQIIYALPDSILFGRLPGGQAGGQE